MVVNRNLKDRMGLLGTSLYFKIWKIKSRLQSCQFGQSGQSGLFQGHYWMNHKFEIKILSQKFRGEYSVRVPAEARRLSFTKSGLFRLSFT